MADRSSSRHLNARLTEKNPPSRAGLIIFHVTHQSSNVGREAHGRETMPISSFGSPRRVPCAVRLTTTHPPTSLKAPKQDNDVSMCFGVCFIPLLPCHGRCMCLCARGYISSVCGFGRTVWSRTGYMAILGTFEEMLTLCAAQMTKFTTRVCSDG